VLSDYKAPVLSIAVSPDGQPFQYVPVSCAKLSSRLREPLYLAGR
jgi:hypothetical protein